MRSPVAVLLSIAAVALGSAVVALAPALAETNRPEPAGATPATSAQAAGAEAAPTSATEAPSSPPAQAPNPFHATISAAVQSADDRGYRTAVSVADTATGEVVTGGDDGLFATESVIKELIAARLLLDGTMDAHDDLARDMIARSNDSAANALYYLAGGDDLIDWMGDRYGIDLGEPPVQGGGWWSGNLVTADGLARLDLALRNDPAVWPWLSDAMHSAEQYGADGEYQYFGLGEATDGTAAIKQGWGNDRQLSIASYNSTGFVTLDSSQPDRYAVVILTECPINDWGARCQSAVTQQAMQLLGR